MTKKNIRQNEKRPRELSVLQSFSLNPLFDFTTSVLPY